MNDKYKELDWFAVRIDEAVEELIEYRNKGLLAFGTFNGVTLYSDTVTMDSAYVAITGKTKAEVELNEKKRIDEREKQKKAHQENIPELSMYWMKKGREVIASDKWMDWDTLVPLQLHDIYEGKTLEACIEILGALQTEESFHKAKEVYEEQGHSGASGSIVRRMVAQFSDKGQSFVDLVQ